MRKLDSEKTPNEEAKLRENRTWIYTRPPLLTQERTKKGSALGGTRNEIYVLFLYCEQMTTNSQVQNNTYLLSRSSVHQGSRLFSWVLSSESHKPPITASVKVHSHLEVWLGKNPFPSISNCWKIHFLAGIELMQLVSSRPSGEHLWPQGGPSPSLRASHWLSQAHPGESSFENYEKWKLLWEEE